MLRARFRSFWLLLAAIVLILPTVFTVSASAQGGPGGRPGGPAASVSPMLAGQSLTQVVNEYGKIKVSMDALGTMDSSGIVHVDKPANATVRKAYLMAATTGFQSHQLSAGEVTILGNGVVWQREIPTSIYSYNYWADVTAVIKPTIDAAPAGMVDVTIGEANSSSVDGTILVVIFDDPNQTRNNSVLLYFGAQNVDGDSFVIDFGQPIDKDDPNLVIDYSLGISYGCQSEAGCAYPKQYSIVDVNNQRLTSAAGGEDDGATSNGALITVGGIGDTNANPADPNAVPVNQFSDDELYDLRPFVADGATSVTINTVNPSDDDNILFAAVVLGATRTVGNIDVDISLYNNPTTAEARAPYEAMLRYMADGVFEASNGAHKIARVTFSPLGANANTADVVWVERCHPNASVSGFGTDGLHVNMCDIFRDGSGPGVDYNFLADDAHQKGGGYTLAHEWGHFYYSLYDEYVGSASYNSIFHFPHSTDRAVTNSIMNSQWNALGGNNNWLNFSIAKNNTSATAQHRVYGASAWETLVRPVADDPRDGDRAALPVRLFHSELSDVQPSGNNDAAIDLPGTARSALSFVWQPAPAAAGPAVLTAPLNAQLVSIDGVNISYPNPILLLAFVHTDLTIINMGVQATVTLPDSSTLPVTFTDDGVPPDAVQNDGLYSAVLGYQANGLYTIQVTFNNNDNTAAFVTTAFSPTADMNGQPVPAQAPVPVGEPFEVSKTLQVIVSNVAADDYGNTPDAAAVLTADNTPRSGKIDAAGDLDVFQLTTAGAWTHYVRVTGLMLGANPQMKIFAADKTTLLFSAALDPQVSEYLFIPLSGLPAGTTVYVEVSDQSAAAVGGLYQVSAGPHLASDRTNQTQIFIPLVRQTR